MKCIKAEIIKYCLPIFSLCLSAYGQEPEISQLKVKGYLDFGHLVNGRNIEASGNQSIDMLALNRGNVTLSQSVRLGDDFEVDAGLTGLIWWPFSDRTTQPNTRVMRVKPMVPLARAKWKFGDGQGNHGHIQVGTFPYKYNPDAKNLGEYLYRSGTYPGFLFTTEGWLFMNRAGQYAHGLQGNFTHLNGMLSHNFSLFMEMVYYPIGDFSPGYDFSFKTKFIELGGGIVLNHFLPIRPSLLEPNEESNIYVTLPQGLDPVDANHVYYGPKDRAPNVDDSLLIEIERWTHKGIKLMGRVNVNLNSLLPEGSSSPEDLKIFLEAAVLGWKDYPLYYEKRAERIPVMFGVNLPSFKLLDVLSVQLEYYGSAFNDFYLFNGESDPRWNYTNGELSTYLDSSRAGTLENWKKDAAIHEDDIKWSIYAKKSFNKVFTLYTQVASDHFRLVNEALTTSSAPLTSTPKEWYYLLRLEFNLR